jgi:hypothetical protein
MGPRALNSAVLATPKYLQHQRHRASDVCPKTPSFAQIATMRRKITKPYFVIYQQFVLICCEDTTDFSELLNK